MMRLIHLLLLFGLLVMFLWAVKSRNEYIECVVKNGVEECQ